MKINFIVDLIKPSALASKNLEEATAPTKNRQHTYFRISDVVFLKLVNNSLSQNKENYNREGRLDTRS